MSTGYLDNYYARLGIPKSATTGEIKTAYHQAARRLHPDSNKNPSATELFLQVQEAYETLSNPARRRKYDESLPEDLNPPRDIMVNAIYSRRSLPAIGAPQLVYVLIDLMAVSDTESLEKRRPPLNLSLVLDTSTSMMGPRLEAVKATAARLIHMLQPDDILSLVSFNDRADVIVPASRALDLGKIESRISIMTARGSTEMLGGLQASLEQISLNLSHNYINQIILVTDGRTYGDEDQCLQLADIANDKGITINALGIGHEWNDEFLDDLARRTGGSCTYADHPEKVGQLLEEKFNQMSYTYANSLCLEYKTPENVEMRYAFRLSPDASSVCSDEKICMGNLPLGANLSILMEFYVKNIDSDKNELVLADGQLHLTVPSRSIPRSSSRITLSRPVSEDPDTTPPPQVLVKAMSQLSLYRMQEQAHSEIQDGKITEATTHLSNLARQLLSTGQPDLAKTVRLELEKLKNGASVSEEGKKKIKYGTRSLVMPPDRE